MAESKSKVRELAEAEAERAEAETPDEEAEQEAEEAEQAPPPEPAEPAPAPPPGELTPEAIAEVERATTAYYKRVDKAFRGNPPPQCAVCNGLGFDLGAGSAEPAYREHEQYRGCGDCDGLGLVLTGSQVPGQDTRECPGCLGRGYVERLPDVAGVDNGEPRYGSPAWLGSAQPKAPPTTAAPGGNVQPWQGDPTIGR